MPMYGIYRADVAGRINRTDAVERFDTADTIGRIAGLLHTFPYRKHVMKSELMMITTDLADR